MRTQSSRRFPKHKKSLIFGILATGDQMKTFWKHEILEMAESDICFVKSGHNHDAAIENCLRSLIVELEAFFCPKNGLQNAPKNLWLTHFLEIRCSPTATVPSLKLTWN